ncbi:MAG: putative Ig domain-containing protein [Coleofasciculus chthonoplastes F3-SA18-01]|uniref:putative Ig domain-containing protein n=1 Tax=Coleofasciculus chthonoplastes TaxID=64178 RepID=UPI0032F36DDE
MSQQLIVTNTQDNGAGSLREALTLAQSGDTIKFSSSIAGDTITLTTGQLEISPGKDITIDGADAPGLTISGNNQSRIFYVNSNQDFNASLTLRNLNLIDGYTAERGGAIEITHQGALTVDNVQFQNNVADNGGGAIYSAWETDLIVNASTFDNNKAVAGNDERGAGAIAFVSPGEITITNSEFTNNQGINGGAINSLQGKLTIENSTFLNNDTTAAFYDTGNNNPFLRGYGGAIYTDRASSGSDETSGTIQIIDSVFEGNKGRGEGGAAYLYTGTQDNVIIEGSLFENNEVLALPNGGNKGNGGAVVQLSNGLNKGLVIRDTTFTNNTAANQGGGLWTYDAPAQIINSTFSGNQTTGDTSGSVGGGMTLYSPTEIIDSTIAYNNASWVGGGVSVSKDADVSVQNTIFYENTADNGTNDWGIQQHTSRELIDNGGNYQYPPKLTNNWNDYNATATITILDVQLEPLQDNGGPVPTHLVGNPDITAGAFFEDSGSTGNGNNDPTLVSPIADQNVEAEDSFSLDITNNFSDADGDNLIYSATLADGTALPDWLTFDSQTGKFRGTHTVVFDLDISPAGFVNNDPTLVSAIADQTVEAEDSFSLDITNNFTDVDGDSLSYSATLEDGTALPDWLTFDSETGTFSGTPDTGDETQLNILVTASDGQGGTQTDGFELDITPAPVVNNDPTLVSAIADQTAQTKELYSLDISDYFNDPDGDALTFSATGLPKGLNLNPDTGVISGTPRNKAIGTNPITLTANDGNGGEISDVFDLTVNRGTTNNGNAKPKVNFKNDLLFFKGNSQASNLLFSLTGNNSPFVSEVGIFEVDNRAGKVNGIKPGETDYLEAALDRGKVLFSSLPNNFAGDNLTRILDVEQVFGETNPNLGFYLVQDNTTDNVRAALDAGQTPTNVWFSLPGANANNTDYFEVLNGESNQFTLNWQNPMAESNDSLTLTVEPTNESPALGTQLQGEQEIIDLRGQTSPVDANFIEVKSHAGFDNSVGLYVIENEDGAVEDPMTGQLIHPEDEGYAQAALAQSVVSDVNRGTVEFNTQLDGGNLLAPFIIANGTKAELLAENPNNQYLGYGEPIAYFSYLGANSDGADHIRLLGDNTFGFEDLHGGGDQDFNDFTFQVDLTIG